MKSACIPSTLTSCCILPEVVAAVKADSVTDLVLDGEVVALGSPAAAPFQVTMRRFAASKYRALQKELPLYPFFFDS